MTSTGKAPKRKNSHIQLEPPVKELCTKLYSPGNPDNIPFREFLDVEINAEKWESPIPLGYTSSQERKTSVTTLTPFEDIYVVNLPPSIHGYEWKKIDEIFPDASFVIKNETGEYPDLKTGSKHLIHSEFVRSFISSIETLYYLGNVKQVPVEYISPSFNPSFEKEPWRPWNHIYCNCKSGKTFSHNPTTNPTGKYIVRLFWLGSWRKIYISDKLPVNENDEVVLPSFDNPTPRPTKIVSRVSVSTTPRGKEGKEEGDGNDKGPNKDSNKGSKKETRKQSKNGSKRGSDKGKKRGKERKEKRVIEIWPYLLSKALMLLASLTWTRENELNDFDIIQCLTGWINNKIYLRTLDSSTIWQICTDHTNQYIWPESEDKEKKKRKGGSVKSSKSRKRGNSEKNSKSSKSVKSSKSIKSSKTSKSAKTSKSKKDKPKEKGNKIKKLTFQRTPKSVEEKVDKNNFILTVALEFQSFQEENSSINWSHVFLVSQTRTVPLLKPSTDEEFEPWKRYRWIDWAIKSKLINPRAPTHPIKSFQTVDPFSEKYRFMIPVKSAEELSSQKVLYSEPETPKTDISKKSKGKKGKSFPVYKDITNWLDFEDVYKFLTYVTVYHRGSTYKSKTRVSSLSCENIKKETKYLFAKKLEQLHGLEWKEIIQPETLLIKRNEPVYLFCDSLFKQDVIMNLSQTGCLSVLEEEEEKSEKILEEETSQCGLCTTTFLERVKRNLEKLDKKVETPDLHKKVHQYSDQYVAEASVIVSKFMWDSERVDDYVASFSSLGSRSHILKLRPGRHVMTIWIQSESPYCLQFYSNTLMCVGNLEEILTLMMNDSLLFRDTYLNLVEDFQYLINCFGTPDYLSALRDFYRSYKPPHPLPIEDSLTIHDVFLKEFFGWICETQGVDALRAVKILFRKWQFNNMHRCNFEDMSIFCYGVDEEDKKYLEIVHDRATKIQSFFKGVYERILSSHHNPKSKYHAKTAEILYKVSENCNENDKLMGARVLRRFMESNTMINYHERYPWYDDMLQQIWLAQFSNTMIIHEPGWVFITRQLFFVRAGPALVVRIHIFCDIDEYVLRVYDNDTSQEMRFHVYNVIVDEYKHNSNGYTLVAYGWSKAPCMITFKVVYACQQENFEDIINFPNIVPKKEEVSQYYVPNVDNYIEKYVLSVKSNLSIVTLHLHTSYPNVKINLKVFSKLNPDNILFETTGIGSVTIPSLFLRCQVIPEIAGDESRRTLIAAESQKSIDGSVKRMIRRSGSKSSQQRHSRLKMQSRDSVRVPSATTTRQQLVISNGDSVLPEIYIIEAVVVDDSWPLSAEEWKKAEEERERRLNVSFYVDQKVELLQVDSRSLQLVKSQLSEDAVIRSGPFSTLKLYYNNNDEISLTRDKTKEDFIKQVKISWYENDPDRYKIAKSLREDFIEQYKIPNENMCTDPNTRSLDHEIFEEEIVSPLEITPFLIKPLEEIQTRIVKSSEDIDEDVLAILKNISDYEFELVGETENKQKFMVQQTESFRIFDSWFEDIQDDSRWMMDRVSAVKQKYLEDLRLMINPKKGKKSDKDKKKKKLL